jgi:tetratricopeptide (TPR) repeat protein
LIENGDFAGAEEIANALEGGDRNELVGFLNRDELLGFIELSKGNPEAAVVLLEKNVEHIGQLNFDCCYLLANAYLETGDLSGAVSLLERALSSYGHFHLRSLIWTVKAHYLLGLAYERSGWTNKAIEKYEEFLEIWKDADEGLPEVEDAKARLALLTHQ